MIYCYETMDNYEKILDILASFQDEPFMYVLQDPEKREQVATKLAKFGVLIADVVDDRVVGILSGYANDEENKNSFINFMVVKREVVGMASFKTCVRLAGSFFELAEARGMKYNYLDVDKDNSNARQIYEKMGYEYTGKETEKTLQMMSPLEVVKKSVYYTSKRRASKKSSAE